MARRKKIPAAVRAQARAARAAEDNPGPTTRAQLFQARLAARQEQLSRGETRDLKWAPDARQTLQGMRGPGSCREHRLQFNQQGVVRVTRETWVLVGVGRSSWQGFYAQPGQVFIVLSTAGTHRPGYTEILTPNHGPCLARSKHLRELDDCDEE